MAALVFDIISEAENRLVTGSRLFILCASRWEGRRSMRREMGDGGGEC